MAGSAKLERLLNLVAELIQTDRPLPAAVIRERLGTYPGDDDSFKRAFERDKDALREMSIPIEMAPDIVTGDIGYFIDRDAYALPDPELAADERAALHLAAAAVRLDGIDLIAGMSKLGGVGTSDAVPRQIAVLPSAPQLGPLLDAVSNERRLRFRHRGKDRTVDPFQLMVDRGHWYLRAWDVNAEGVRTYRVDRIEGEVSAEDAGSVEVVIDASDYPVELAEWALGDREPTVVTVRVQPRRVERATRIVGTSGAVRDNEDGSVDIDLPVRSIDGLRGFVLSFLGEAEVVAPPAVRAEMIEWLEAMATQEER